MVVNQVLQKQPGLPGLVGLFVDHCIADPDLASSEHFYVNGLVFHIIPLFLKTVDNLLFLSYIKLERKSSKN